MTIPSFGAETLRKVSLAIPRCRWYDNVKTDFKEVGREELHGIIWLMTGTNGELLWI